MTFAVKVVLNPNTTNQPTKCWQPPVVSLFGHFLFQDYIQNDAIIPGNLHSNRPAAHHTEEKLSHR